MAPYCVISYIVVLSIFVSVGTSQARAQSSELDFPSQNGRSHGYHGAARSGRISGSRAARGDYNRQRSRPTSALEQMLNVTSLDDFLSLLIKDEHAVTSKDIYSKYPSQSGQKMIVGGGVLAVLDYCSPRPTTVKLEVTTGEETDVYFPTTTQVDRCGGGSASPSRHVVCVPEQTEQLRLNVIKAQLPFHGATRLLFSGFQSVLVSRHLSCRLQCELTQEKCEPGKHFVPATCQCECADDTRCLGNKVWDAESCRCACARKKECCCGMIFNPESCYCEINLGGDEIPSRDPSSIREEEDDNLQRQRDENTSTTLTTTTTTTTTPSPMDKCASIRCPPSFTVHLGSDGVCVCWPPAERRYYYRRRYFRKRQNWLNDTLFRTPSKAFVWQ